jgi:hypothetical protein
MIGSRHALKIFETIVVGIIISVVDVAAVRDRTESKPPHVSMKFLAATRMISLTWPKPVQATIEILRDFVEPHRITVFGVRNSANLHPLAVLNG